MLLLHFTGPQTADVMQCVAGCLSAVNIDYSRWNLGCMPSYMLNLQWFQAHLFRLDVWMPQGLAEAARHVSIQPDG